MIAKAVGIYVVSPATSEIPDLIIMYSVFCLTTYSSIHAANFKYSKHIFMHSSRLKQVPWWLHVRRQNYSCSFIDQLNMDVLSWLKKWKIHLAADHYPQESFNKQRTDIVDSAIELVTADWVLHCLLTLKSVNKVLKKRGLWWWPQGKFTSMNLWGILDVWDVFSLVMEVNTTELLELHFLQSKQLKGITVEKIIGMYLCMCMM